MRWKQRPAISSRIEGIGTRIERWRKTRQKRSPMPAELWNSAVELASANGTCRVARALRLDYAALKNRVVQDTRGKEDRGAGFIELDGATLAGSSAATVLELSDASGAKPLEPVGIVSYVLAGYRRRTLRSSEAALKCVIYRGGPLV